ncbi:hypothetical protein TYRP_009503 [Tyrophagus putrescentiae]|nr:hypothetical protein TYRP_009503 [Tyrophagus putrescentiae]
MKVLLICLFILPIIINYLPQPVLSQKEHYCGDITDCTRVLGVHSTCNKYGRCICAINYHEKATPENGNEKKTSCERMSSCGGLDLTCMNRYGMHSKCSKSNGELCFCEEGYRFDTASRHSFSDCERDLGPSGAICVRNTGQCVCEMGYEQVEQDHNNSGNHSTVYSCEKKSCSMPIDCTVKWGSGAHCSAYSCYCGGSGFGLKLGIPGGVVGFAVIYGAVVLFRWFSPRRQKEVELSVVYQQPPPPPSSQQQPPMVIRHQNPQEPSFYSQGPPREPEIAHISISVVELNLHPPPPSSSPLPSSSLSSSYLGDLPEESRNNDIRQPEPHSPPLPYNGQQESPPYNSSANQPPQSYSGK